MHKIVCPACSSAATHVYFQVKNSPSLQNVLYETQTLAENAHTVEAEFLACENCSLLFNPRFVEAPYSRKYNNDQSLSSTYREHVRAVASLVSEALEKKSTVLEIGCGNGLVLSMLRDHGFEVEGYDPAHAEGLPYVKQDIWRPSERAYDAVLFRHTLEGIPAFEQLLFDVAQKLRSDGLIYVEFTNSRRIIEQGATVTLYHEYAQYFSETALGVLFERMGMYVHCIRHFFDGDISGVIARRKNARAARRASFKKLAGYKNVHIWGISGRSIHFLTNYVQELECVAFAVDIDPKKQGKYVPFSGQKILSPDECVSLHPDALIVLNEHYAREIAAIFPYPIVILTAKDFYVGE